MAGGAVGGGAGPRWQVVTTTTQIDSDSLLLHIMGLWREGWMEDSVELCSGRRGRPVLQSRTGDVGGGVPQGYALGTR